MAFGILFFLLTIAMFSNIVLLIGAAMAERFVFFASAGFCLSVAFIPALLVKGTSIFSSLYSKKWFLYWPVCIIFALFTLSRNSDWKDNYTLFKTDAEKAPTNARLQYSLGNEMLKTQYKDEHDPKARKQILLDAMSNFKAALNIYPGYAKAHADLGNAFFRLQQFDSAEVHEQQAVLLNPKDPIALSNLGGVYFVNKKYPEAIATIRKALILNPSNVSIMNNLSLCYLELQHYDSSISISYGVLRIEQNNALAMENLVAAYKALGKTDSVQKYEALPAKPGGGRRTH
jgi:protein O-mannosyl-transferase